MKQTMADLVKLRAREAESQLSDHPSPEKLVAYHWGQISDEDGDRLQGHLAVCGECSALYLDLVEMVEETPPVDSTEWVGAWPEMERLLKDEVSRAVPLPMSAPPRSASLRRFWQSLFGSPRLAYVFATVFFLAACGLFAWNVNLRQTVEVLSSPQMNVAIHDLDSGSVLRAEGAVVEPVEVGGGADRIVLVLNPAESPSELSYRVRIFDDSGREVWSGRGLRSTSFGNFTLEISRRFFRGERYMIELRGDREGGGRDGLIDRFEIRFLGR